MALNATATAVEMHGGNLATIIISLAVSAVVLLFWRLNLSGIDPREPPEVSSKIPFIGHIIGMLTYHVDYYAMLK
jgi:hypothetical protein